MTYRQKYFELKKINMVITKDMSRLGRDYIGTGEYIEKYFPSKKVRYIAVTDGIDTGADTSSNDMAPFKAVFNDMYAKDIWQKDLNKDIVAVEKGIKLVRIKEYDWDNEPLIKEIIKSYL